MLTRLIILQTTGDVEKNVESSLLFIVDAWLLSLGIFVGMILFIFIGRKIGIMRREIYLDGDDPARGTIVSSMFGLLAFLLAFTFSMSSNRFDARRSHIVQEANAIGMALMRCDMYPEPIRSAFRNDFRHYVDARILYFKGKRDMAAVTRARGEADIYAKRIWARACNLSPDVKYAEATRQMIPALNAMIDVSITRLSGELALVPSTIVLMLFVLSWAGAFFLGYMSAKKPMIDWLLATGFCVLTAVVIYITLDLDRPRRGFIQLDSAHRAMDDLQKEFK